VVETSLSPPSDELVSSSGFDPPGETLGIVTYEFVRVHLSIQQFVTYGIRATESLGVLLKKNPHHNHSPSPIQSLLSEIYPRSRIVDGLHDGEGADRVGGSKGARGSGG
jgi:hypothetical protein